MRTAITIGIHHGGEIVEMLAAAPTSIDVQRRAFKQLRASPTHERFESIELWDSGVGRILRHRFKPHPSSIHSPTDPLRQQMGSDQPADPNPNESAGAVNADDPEQTDPEGTSEPESEDGDDFQIRKPKPQRNRGRK